MYEIVEKPKVDMILVVNLMAVLGLHWRGWWQYEGMKHMLDNVTSLIQGSRQITGKTWLLTLLAFAYIFMGYTVIIGMPTFGQATKILFKEINKLCRVAERILPAGQMIRLQPDNQSHICWNNGGELIAMSAGKMADKEGFTAALVIIDEGHRLEPETLDIIEPFVSLAMMDGYGRCVLAGVGGPPESLIEKKKKRGAYKALKITPERILAEAPQYQKLIDHAKKSMTPQGYDQMYNCNVVTAGLRYAYDILPYDIGITKDSFVASEIFGIDPGGHGRDHTVCAHASVYTNGKIVWDDHYNITNANNIDQAKDIFDYVNQWIYTEENIAIEKNGLGIGLYDNLVHPSTNQFAEIKLVNMSTGLKKWMFRTVKKMMLDGDLAVTDEYMREDMEGILESVSPGGESTWSHSDVNSAVLVGMASQGSVTSFFPWSVRNDAEATR